MGFIDNVRNRIVNLAENKPPLNRESGVGPVGIDLDEDGTVKSPSDLTIKDFRKMRENDGTVSAMYNILVMSVKSTEYQIEGEESPELKLVRENLLKTPEEGGMQTSMDLLIADMLRGIQDGFRYYEKVFTLNDQGQIVYKKIANRDSKQITLKADKNGEFNGAVQKIWQNLESREINIPANRSFLFTINKEMNPLYGESMFKSAYYHYDKKHKYYYLEYLQDQAAAIPPRKLKIVGNPDSEAIAQAEAAADKFGVRQRITLTKDFELEEYETNPQDLSPKIQHHNMQMALSILVQFLLLGSEGRGGAYSLSENHSKIAKMVVGGITKQIEAHINSYLIPDLIDYNFASGVYPRFQFTELDEVVEDVLNQAFTEILKSGSVDPRISGAIADKVATSLGIEVEELEEVEEVEVEEDVELAEHEETSLWYRPLTKAESQVKLSEIDQKMDTFEAQFGRDARELLDKMTDDITRQVTKLVANENLDGLSKIQFKDLAQYQKLLKDTTMQAYLYGKQTASDELDVKIPASTSESKTFVKENAQAVAEKQANDLLFIVKTEVTKQLRKTNLSEVQLGLSDVIAAITAAFATYYDNKILAGGAAAVTMGINKGRDDVFMLNDDMITRYQFSAILDARTCECCRQLDGSVVGEATYRTTEFNPPVHLNCRCIWVAIKVDEVDPPEITGMNAAPACSTIAHLSEKTIEFDEKVNERMDTMFSEIDHIRKEVKSANERNERVQSKLDALEL